MLNKIFIGSNNLKKSNEINELFKNNKLNVQIYTPKDFDLDTLNIIEDGNDFEQNALIKAKTFFDKTNIPVLSDDSGLCVDCLGGEPGLYSSRYSGDNANDNENMDFLIDKLKIYKPPYLAHFRTTMCFFDGKIIKYFNGKIKGQIITIKKGTNGFGYDPIFIPKGYENTFAELPNIDKNEISHRKIALSKFINFMNKILLQN